jgi:hypothetical protein
LDEAGVSPDRTDNWCRFDTKNKQLMRNVRQMIHDNGGVYQMPMYAPKGSVILWLSTLAHSAKNAKGPVPQSVLDSSDDKFFGWRGVVYVCYRPLEEFNQQEREARKQVVKDNRVTNHWSLKVFDSVPGSQYQKNVPRHANIMEYVKDPSKLYEVQGYTPSTEDCVITTD